MTALSYRLVQFVPDPYSGARVPVAALLSDGDVVRVVRSTHIPGPECLGGARRAALVRMVMDALHEVTGFDRLPPSVGPQAILDGSRRVPAADLDGAERWVREHVLSRADKGLKGEPDRSRSPHRPTFGRRFFETWGVSEYVHATFRPASDLGGRLARLSAYGEISHWVEGQGRVLLMEPIVPRRQRFADDLREIAKLFGSYRFELDQHPADGGLVQLVGYLLPGGTDEQKADAAVRVPAAHQIVDTEDQIQRGWLLETIRALGRTGERQQRVGALKD